MKNCPNCNKKCKNDQTYCLNCGEIFKDRFDSEYKNNKNSDSSLVNN